MNYFSLLLNVNYQPINFINYKKAANFLIKEKIDIINYWDVNLTDSYKLPATCRIKYYTPFFQKNLKYSRKIILLRDQYICQYCGYAGTNKDMTIDHIVPKSLGGEHSFTNCVAACKGCNITKGARRPEEANMKLINNIKHYNSALSLEYVTLKNKHPEWKLFIK
jgi:5-methylcytosine-specific restriction endonuclease McrA